ncbi:MAG: Putative oxidoreductase, partial [uncultured Friedmanniella sp.]
ERTGGRRDRSRQRDRVGDSDGAGRRRLAGGAGRAPGRRLGRGRVAASRPAAPRAHRRHRRGLGAGAVRHRRRRARPGGPAVQQRRPRLLGADARRDLADGLAGRRRRQPHRGVPLHPGGVPGDAGAAAPGRADHQQRLDLGDDPASALGPLRRHQARAHRADQGHRPRRPRLRHRLRADRHRERGDGTDRADGRRHPAGRRQPASGAPDGCRRRGPRRRLHGLAAAGGQRPAADGDGHRDALPGPGL